MRQAISTKFHGPTNSRGSRVKATAREHFADIGRRCIADAQSGATRVNDLARYVEWQEHCIAESLSGRGDRSLTFMQRALYLQTGDCPALLS